ncbi:MAG: hypothetical protein HZA93_14370 [Verrucomicrobia bacterium]|nr:hypothetical protein [Verrucomicrobiota bacterium]
MNAPIVPALASALAYSYDTKPESRAAPIRVPEWCGSRAKKCVKFDS